RSLRDWSSDVCSSDLGGRDCRGEDLHQHDRGSVDREFRHRGGSTAMAGVPQERGRRMTATLGGLTVTLGKKLKQSDDFLKAKHKIGRASCRERVEDRE